MTVKLPEKNEVIDPKDPADEKPEGEEILPGDGDAGDDDAGAEVSKAEDAAEKNRKLEIELAEARGKLSVLTEKATPSAQKVSATEEQYWQTKRVVLNDVSGLDDEAFGKKYGMSKVDVKLHYVDYERNMESQKNSEKLAKMEAENEMLTKYGASYAKVKAQIQEAIDDASPEVRKDPVRLAKFIERTYHSFAKDEEQTPAPKPAKKKEGDTVSRRVVSDFDAPNPADDRRDRSKEKNDALEGEQLEVGRHFGITTKSELDKYSGNKLEMRFGGGVVLRDEKKGFEKVSKG